MTLTDEDRAARLAIWQRALQGEFATSDIDEAIYIAGLRAGMERAAVMCDGWIGVIADGTYVAERLGQEIRKTKE